MIFETLHEASFGLHKRFDNFPPELDGQAYAFEEEVQEVLDEVHKFKKGEGDREKLVEEVLDVMVTLSGILLAAKVSTLELIDKAQAIAEKNNKKNHTTHLLDPGSKKIRRKWAHEILEELNGDDKDQYVVIERPEWVKHFKTAPGPISTKDGKHVLALAMKTKQRNSKYISCQVVYAKGVVGSEVVYQHVDTPIVHDKQQLQKLLKLLK